MWLLTKQIEGLILSESLTLSLYGQRSAIRSGRDFPSNLYLSPQTDWQQTQNTFWPHFRISPWTKSRLSVRWWKERYGMPVGDHLKCNSCIECINRKRGPNINVLDGTGQGSSCTSVLLLPVLLLLLCCISVDIYWWPRFSCRLFYLHFIPSLVQIGRMPSQISVHKYDILSILLLLIECCCCCCIWFLLKDFFSSTALQLARRKGQLEEMHLEQMWFFCNNFVKCVLWIFWGRL